MNCEDNLNQFDYKLKTPFVLCISGGTQSGKTTLASKIIIRQQELLDPPVDQIIYCFTEWQENLFSFLKSNVKDISFHKGLPTNYDSSKSSLSILDDLMTEISKSEEIVNLVARTSHHRNISVLFLTQVFFYKNLNAITRNLKYLILIKNPRENSFVSIIGRQMNGGKRNIVMESCFKDVIKKDYGHMLVDYSLTQNDKYRIRDSVFPEKCYIYCD